MKIPRDVGGKELVKVLGRFGYKVVRQTGSHIRLVSNIRGYEHRVTVPAHDCVRVGTLTERLL